MRNLIGKLFIPTSQYSEGQNLKEFSEIYEEYALYIRKVIFWYSRVNPAELDDLVQETFIKIWKKMHKFEHRSELKTWIYRIAINTAKDSFRGATLRQLLIQNVPDLAKDENLETKVINRNLILIGIQSLDAKLREVFILSYKLELSQKEISDILEIPVGTVKSRLSKARENFKLFLHENEVEYE